MKHKIIICVTFNCVKICAALLKSHSLSCRHLWQGTNVLNYINKWFHAKLQIFTFSKTRLTFGTIPGSCQTSGRRLWASPAAVRWEWAQGWKMESVQEQRRLDESPLLWPFGWKAGHSRCTNCGKGGKQWGLNVSGHPHFCWPQVTKFILF